MHELHWKMQKLLKITLYNQFKYNFYKETMITFICHKHKLLQIFSLTLPIFMAVKFFKVTSSAD